MLKIFTPSSDDAWVLKGAVVLFWKRFEATLNVQYRCRDWYWFSFLRFLDQKVVLKAVLSYLSFPIVSCHSCSLNSSSDFIEVKPLYIAASFFWVTFVMHVMLTAKKCLSDQLNCNRSSKAKLLLRFPIKLLF